ncbi:MAG: hypothetical protein COB46_06975 [Rhodospirillaceae bacterium]|nr:MAG: hypothetical protein COB46_06975 [Rhodospirillaceae bacterium]
MGNSDGKGGGGSSQTDMDNHANQLNSNNDAYTESQESEESSQADTDNHANQLNPNNDSYGK